MSAASAPVRTGEAGPLKVAIVGAGTMGAALGRRIGDHGGLVTTVLDGRSPGTVARAQAAGMADRSLAEIGDCDLLLSVTPPDAALPLARALARQLGPGRPRLAYLDCNAIAPRTSCEIAGLLSNANTAYIDGAIVGGPPGRDGPAPIIFVSGPDAELAAPLRSYGLDIRRLDAPVGSASALKMALAVVSKGVTAMLCLGGMAAASAGVLDAFSDQLSRGQPGVLAWGDAQIPGLHAKASRWVQEMRILEQILDHPPGSPAIFSGLAALYGWAAEGESAPAELAELGAHFIARRDLTAAGPVHAQAPAGASPASPHTP